MTGIDLLKVPDARRCSHDPASHRPASPKQPRATRRPPCAKRNAPATDDDLVEGDESLTLNGTVGNAAAGIVTLAIEDRTVITCPLSGPADSNIVEDRSYELTATASSPVKADTTVEIMRDAAASDAGPDDYNVESIVIEAGETTGTTTLMVVDDDLPNGGTGTNRVEALVLLGSVDGVEIGELTFIIWDAAVPALPVGGALLIEALLLWCGAVRTRGRGDEPGTLGRCRGRG